MTSRHCKSLVLQSITRVVSESSTKMANTPLYHLNAAGLGLASIHIMDTRSRDSYAVVSIDW